MVKLGVVAAVLLAGTGVASAALGVSFTDAQAVSFGEVKYTQSELVVTQSTLVGPGTNVDSVELTVKHPNAGGSGAVDATVELWLLDGDTEVATGTITERFTPGETTVTVDLDTRVRSSEFSAVDIQILEQ